MMKLTKDNLFPKLATAEAKRLATERAAQSTTELEVAQRDAKTAALRAARLAKEAADRDAVTSAKLPKRSAKAITDSKGMGIQ